MHDGVVRTTEFPSLRTSWSERVTSGELIAALPGVVMDASLKDNPFAWIRAVHIWNPNAVIAGAAAAKLTFATELKLTTIRVLTSSKLLDRGPIRFHRCSIHPDLLDWVGELRVTGPDATALSAGIDGDYEPGTSALRLRLVTPESIAAAARRWTTRPRSAFRAAVNVLGSNPWSVAEVEAHRLFREIGIIGWVGNPRLIIDRQAVYPDIALLAPKIAFEINSFAHHSSRYDMERDSSRMNLLIAAGWQVYVMTPSQVRNNPVETAEFVKRVVPRAFRRGVGGRGR